jgi:uncharacterized membrane protein YeaQ/YmgE (transglycosylase-associated protein family)
MFQLIWWIIYGLIVGVLDRFILPGRDAISWLATIVLGIVGSLVGGLISMLLFSSNDSTGFQPAGFLLSLVGAILVLLVWRKIKPGTTVG